MNNTDKTWLHIGAGSFHRAHQAWYLHRLLLAGEKDWSISLGNIRDDVTPTLEKLAAQNCQYTLETVDPRGHREYERITSIREVISWDADLSALVARGASPSTRVIAFTVTESGYYLDPEHKLEKHNPDIKTDLNGGAVTIYGTIARILRKRMWDNGGPVTLLSCDNVRHNGERFRDGLLQFLAALGESEFAVWVEENTTCPCCMVDRITPRPGPDLPPRVLAATGFADAVPVMSESFIQWVVEDNFKAGRPALETVGVEMVADVAPYEEAKIRILNSSHALIAWAGTLAGLSYIHEDVANPAIRRMAEEYVTRDVIPCLTPCPLDLAAYRDTVLDRFGNSYIQDTNQRVGADGFSKIPAMITPTLRECYARGVAPEATAMLPAVFYVFMKRWNDGGIPYDYQDGIMNAGKVKAMFKLPDPLEGYAADTAMFAELGNNPDFAVLLRGAVARVEAWLRGEG